MHGLGMGRLSVPSEESTRLAHERKTLEEEAIDWGSQEVDHNKQVCLLVCICIKDIYSLYVCRNYGQ